jgi:glycosyltransferase involved in cell wall biosynthesis
MEEFHKPLVSIIIPLYNAENFIADAIESIINQSYSNWEVIIVNDESNDNSLTVAKEYESNKIKIYSKKNGGAAAARNYGYYKSKGEFIKFFDADDLINPEMIASQVNIAIKNPNSIISGKWGRFYSNDLISFQLNPEECWQDLNPIDWLYSSLRNAQSMTQCGIFLIPRILLEKGGLWNEKLSLIDDHEFFTRIILTSENVKYCKDAILYYRSGIANSLSKLTSLTGAKSELLAIQLATAKLLERENSPRIRSIIANSYGSFMYNNYPKYKDLRAEAKENLKEFGKPNFDLLVPKRYLALSKVFGWKTIKGLMFLKNNLLK